MHIKITGSDVNGSLLRFPTAKIELNGVDISSYVTAIRTHARAGEFFTVAIELLPSVIELDLDVVPEPGSELATLVEAVRAMPHANAPGEALDRLREAALSARDGLADTAQAADHITRALANIAASDAAIDD